MTTESFPLARYIRRLSLAEAAGIAVVALAYAMLDRGLLAAEIPVILGAGAWEGACLGLAQASVLARFGARPGRWVAATILGATAGYALSIAGGAGAGPPGAAEPPFWLILAGGGAMGLGMGGLMGLVQIPALPRLAPPLRWVAVNALAWIPAMMLIMTGASAVGSDWPLIAVMLVGAVCGALAGAVVGLVTGASLAHSAGSIAACQTAPEGRRSVP